MGSYVLQRQLLMSQLSIMKHSRQQWISLNAFASIFGTKDTNGVFSQAIWNKPTVANGPNICVIIKCWVAALSVRISRVHRRPYFDRFKYLQRFFTFLFYSFNFCGQIQVMSHCAADFYSYQTCQLSQLTFRCIFGKVTEWDFYFCKFRNKEIIYEFNFE